MFDFDKILTLEKQTSDIAEKINSHGNVVFYGLGSFLKYGYNNLTSWLGNPVFIVDKCGSGSYRGVPVIKSVDKAVFEFGNHFSVVITAPSYFDEIKSECLKYIEEDRIFKFPSCGKNFMRTNQEKIRKFADSLCDVKSEITFENWLCGKVSNDIEYFYKSFLPNRFMNIPEHHNNGSNRENLVYFPDDIYKISENEVFFDCGAFDGDTAADFIKASKGKYGRIVSLEFDSANFESLKRNTETLRDITLIFCGVWNENTFCEIHSDGTVSSSVFSEETAGADETASDMKTDKESENNVPLRKIDDLSDELGCIPTLIKMDIEGSELNALKGAEQTILKHKPKLAICIYHKNEDIIDIPEYILSVNPDYKFYVRHYDITASELVLFAI